MVLSVDPRGAGGSIEPAAGEPPAPSGGSIALARGESPASRARSSSVLRNLRSSTTTEIETVGPAGTAVTCSSSFEECDRLRRPGTDSTIGRNTVCVRDSGDRPLCRLFPAMTASFQEPGFRLAVPDHERAERSAGESRKNCHGSFPRKRWNLAGGGTRGSYCETRGVATEWDACLA